MPIVHTVRQGEHVPGIAEEYGFTDWNLIWNDGANAALKAQRKDPNILFPGDRLTIPDRQEKHLSRGTDQQHRFRLGGKPLRLKTVLQRQYGLAFSDLLGRFNLDGEGRPAITDGNGKIDRPISRQAKQAVVTLDEEIPGTPGAVVIQQEFQFLIGCLDPSDTLSGQRHRLLNLGYYQAAFDQDDAALFKSAVEEFQCEHGLVVDGVCGPATRAKLEQVHGC